VWLICLFPSGIYWVINPYYDISRVVAALSDAKQNYPNNMECVHPGLCHFYTILKPQEFGLDIDVVLFWFGDGLHFCSIRVGPFGHRANYFEEMANFKAFTQRVQSARKLATHHLVQQGQSDASSKTYYTLY